MEAQPGAMDISALLTESEWIGGLARSLIGDAHAAEDLAQDTRLAALRSEVRRDRSLRPWLATVARNGARMLRRSEGTRKATEASRATLNAADSARSPEELMSNLETQELVMRFVRELPEDLSHIILATFVEGHTPAEIARLAGIPAGTVRWRKSEALKRLRERLESHYEGDRTRWLAALAPLAQLRQRGVRGAAASTASTGPLAALWITMSVTWKVAAAIAAAVLLTLALRATASPTLPANGAAAIGRATDVASAEPERDLVVPHIEGVQDPSPARTVSPPPAHDTKAAARRSRTRVALKVVDAAGLPVAGALVTPRFSLEIERDHRHVIEALSPTELLRLTAGFQRTTDTEGRAIWETDLLEFDGTITFRAEGPRHETGSVDALVQAEQLDNEVVLQLAPGATIRGRIVHADGTAPRRQLVFLVPEGSPLLRANEDAIDWIGHVEVADSVHAEPGGSFELKGVPDGRYVAATSPLAGHPQAFSEPFDVMVGARLDALQILVEPNVLGRPGVLVQDPQGEVITTARVVLKNGDFKFSGVVGSDGRYELPTVYERFAGGSIQVVDEAGLHRPGSLDTIPEGPRTLTVTLRPRPTKVQAFRLVGRAGEQVTEHHATILGEDWKQKATGKGALWTMTLPATGALDVEAWAPGFLRRTVKGLRPSELTEVHEILLDPDPGIRGLVTVNGEPQAGVRVRLHSKWEEGHVNTGGNEVSRRGGFADETKTGPDGRFQLYTSVSGEYVLITKARRLGAACVDLGMVEVGAARDEIDVPMAPGGRLEGVCVNASGEPVAGALLVLNHPYHEARRARAKKDGSFTFRRIPAGSWFLRSVGEFESPFMSGTTSPPQGWVYPTNVEVLHGQTAKLRFVLQDPLDTSVRGSWEATGFAPSEWTVTLNQGRWVGEKDPFVEDHEETVDLDVNHRFQLSASSRADAVVFVRGAGMEGTFQRRLKALDLPGVLDYAVGIGRIQVDGDPGEFREIHFRSNADGWLFHAQLEVGSSSTVLVPSGPVELNWIGANGELRGTTTVRVEVARETVAAPPPN